MHRRFLPILWRILGGMYMRTIDIVEKNYATLEKEHIKTIWAGTKDFKRLLVQGKYVELEHSSNDTLKYLKGFDKIAYIYCATARHLQGTNQIGRILSYDDGHGKLHIQPIVGSSYVVDITLELDRLTIFDLSTKQLQKLNQIQ